MDSTLPALEQVNPVDEVTALCHRAHPERGEVVRLEKEEAWMTGEGGG